ncbi:hypothetical protein EGT74_26555 [Chitinophaga lutea]|uniref:Cupin domain-containing protein n=1 Tax=Chitinophaga lutea TaxID=2488634 RepID=A0A3N4PQC5_9BACT|nr:hypothetical protein [Chitinophaga lutea]RPE05920.1 hypothetical protein EGT74_26555 [Chitinophaga lutea]
MSEIIITPLELRGEDERGRNYEWQTFRTGTFVLCYRNAGSSSGQHYHTGASDYKNPEIMYLLSGKAAIHWCPIEETVLRTVEVEAPARVEIPIRIWHQLVAVTDCSFMELNTMEDVRMDSVRVWRDDFLRGKR